MPKMILWAQDETSTSTTRGRYRVVDFNIVPTKGDMFELPDGKGFVEIKGVYHARGKPYSVPNFIILKFELSSYEFDVLEREYGWWFDLATALRSTPHDTGEAVVYPIEFQASKRGG
jgi:hypothetical protein